MVDEAPEEPPVRIPDHSLDELRSRLSLAHQTLHELPLVVLSVPVPDQELSVCFCLNRLAAQLAQYAVHLLFVVEF
jgi:hypothetical protein